MALTTAQRKAAERKRRQAAGQVRKEYWATPEQHAQIAALLSHK